MTFSERKDDQRALTLSSQWLSWIVIENHSQPAHSIPLAIYITPDHQRWEVWRCFHVETGDGCEATWSFLPTFLCLPSHYQSLDQFPYFSVKFHLYWYWHPLQLRNGSNKWNDNLPISRQNNPTLLFMYCTVYYDKTVSHALNDFSCNAGSTKWELHFCLTRYSWSLNTDQYCKRRVHTHTHTHTHNRGSSECSVQLC